MKKIMMPLAFLLAIAGAFFTQANASKLATRYQQADPAHKATTCKTINCGESSSNACLLIDPGYSTYKSTGIPECDVVTTLFKNP